MKEIKQFICVVDIGGPPCFQHNKAGGRYRVAAKDKEEAIKFLRAAVRCGSVRCLGTAKSCEPDENLPQLPYKFIGKYPNSVLRPRRQQD